MCGCGKLWEVVEVVAVVEVVEVVEVVDVLEAVDVVEEVEVVGVVEVVEVAEVVEVVDVVDVVEPGHIVSTWIHTVAPQLVWTSPRAAHEQTEKRERVCVASRGARLLIHEEEERRRPSAPLSSIHVAGICPSRRRETLSESVSRRNVLDLGESRELQATTSSLSTSCPGR